MFRRRQIMADFFNFIYFENKDVESICLANFDKDGDGRISKEDAEKVTSFDRLFNNISSLENLNDFRLFCNVKNINSAFIGCPNLRTLRIWEGVVRFGDNTFMNANKIEKVIIPSTVKDMGQMWVRNRFIDPAIIVMLPPSPPAINTYNILAGAKVMYVPDESVELYKNNANMKTYISENILPISQYKG